MERIERPVTVQTRDDLAVLVCDGSPSMNEQVLGIEGFTGTKGAVVGIAIRDLLMRLTSSRRSANFSFAGITFADRVTSQWGPVRAGGVDLTRTYDPTAVSASATGTSLASGLTAAANVARAHLAADGDLPRTVTVLLLSDGQCQSADASRAAAVDLKRDPRVRLVTAFLATHGRPDDGLALLRDVATHPAAYCTTVYDAETLRRYWEASLSTAAALPPGPSAQLALP